MRVPGNWQVRKGWPHAAPGRAFDKADGSAAHRMADRLQRASCMVGGSRFLLGPACHICKLRSAGMAGLHAISRSAPSSQVVDIVVACLPDSGARRSFQQSQRATIMPQHLCCHAAKMSYPHITLENQLDSLVLLTGFGTDGMPHLYIDVTFWKFCQTGIAANLQQTVVFPTFHTTPLT